MSRNEYYSLVMGLDEVAKPDRCSLFRIAMADDLVQGCPHFLGLQATFKMTKSK